MTRLIRNVTHAVTAAAVLTVVVACTTPGRLPAAHVAALPVNEVQSASAVNSIKVVSLNAAHSRSMGFHQALQSSDEARANLDAIVDVLERENPDIVALQEVDGPSVWSGKFDHVEYIAQNAAYSSTVRGTHMKTAGLDYGTALLARQDLSDAVSVGFGGALLVARKGFVISSVQWPGRLDTSVDVVSVHLDPLRAKVRAHQVNELIDVIEERGRPVIVMGDFNDDWYDDEAAVRLLGDALNLKPHDLRCEECHTHRRMKDFVDWILVSKEIRIENFEILSDDISDHYAVAATLHLNDTSGERGLAAH
jgi:endonuclease/exonuclease/phosphatase family metal-dependent hydrolase